ncbi:uncharacterized protein LOC135502273 [Lineus longissimus]|uniref:uncharacterized protein LOC135502273 n=1 Tax=Lineus longissimus TaxID=88925 RepID=UPI002B4E20BD
MDKSAKVSAGPTQTMASNSKAIGMPALSCLLCKGTPNDLEVAQCQHAVCKNCLSTHNQRLGQDKESFPCPLCRVDSLFAGNVAILITDSDGLVSVADTSQFAHGSRSGDGLVSVVDGSQVAHASSSSDGLVSVTSQVAHASSSSDGLVSVTSQVAHASSSSDGLVSVTSQVAHASSSSDGLVSVADASQIAHGSSSNDVLVSVENSKSHEVQDFPLKLDNEQEALVEGLTAICTSCRYTKNIQAIAESLCEECGSLYLCRDCANVHNRNRSTANHVVISLKRMDEGCCSTHMEVINRYCGTCSQPCCNLCVLLDHGDHKIRGIGEVFYGLVDDLNHVALEQERRAKDLRNFEGQLNSIKSSKVAERRRILAQEIDDHAQVCIAQITKQRDALKDRVEDGYKVLNKVTECLNKIPTLVLLDETVDKAKVVLTEVEPHPNDIEKLTSIRNEFMNWGLKDEVDSESYLEIYQQLFNNPFHFVPTLPNFNIGALEAMEMSSNYRDINLCKLIYERKLAADDASEVIPCVANLGNGYYAAAHPTLEGTPSDGIDICKVPGEFLHCFHECPVYDMAATPEGHLAVLTTGSAQEASCAHLVNPVEGNTIGSTSDFPIRHALSFDVNFYHQYVILSNDGGRRITICNKDGTLDQSHKIDESHGVKDSSRIVCSRKYIYVLGRKRFVIFDCKSKELGLVLVATSENEFTTLTLTDISVTDFDEITVCYEGGTDNHFWFGRCVLHKGSLSGWNIREMSGQARRTRLSRNHDYMVTSQEGSIIRVYEESTT